MSKDCVGSRSIRDGAAAACALLACRLMLEPDCQAQTAELDPVMRAAAASYMRRDYDGARQQLDQAWKLVDETAPDNPARYEVWRRRSALEAAAGQPAEADSYLRQAINWRQNAFGETDPVLLNDLLEDATLCRTMHDYDRALAILQQVRNAHVRAGGFESAPVAGDLSRIAQIYLDQQKTEDAAGTLTASLGILAKLNGDDHYALLPDLDRLGEVLIVLRQYDEAEKAYRRGLVIRERVFGKDSANLLTSIDGLAYACFGQNKFDEAEPLYQRLVALWEASAGKEHPMVAMTLDKVAVFYRKEEKWAEAQETADRATAIRAHFLASGLAHEATERLGEHKNGEAIALYRRALGVLDPPHPVFEELRNQIAGNLKTLEPPGPKPRRPKGAVTKKLPK